MRDDEPRPATVWMSPLITHSFFFFFAVIILCFIFDGESFSKMFLSVSARVIRLRLTLGYLFLLVIYMCDVVAVDDL